MTGRARDVLVRPRTGLLAIVAGLALLAAACSGGPSAAGGSGGAPAGVGSASSPAGGSGGSSSAGRPAASQKQLAYSKCMRAHGVPGVPTSVPSVSPGPPPSNGSHWEAGPVGGPSPGSPQFQAAQQACRSLVPPPRWVPG
jgi:hypothetical protein